MGDVSAGRIIAVTGTRQEAGLLKHHAVQAIAGGGDADRLRQILTEQVQGAAGLISYGTCGAMDRSLALGMMVIGQGVTGVLDAPCDALWVEALRGLLPQARVGMIHADGQLLSQTQDKAARAGASAAIAVDMESHIVAEVAVKLGLPFAILRCVSDEAGAPLPPAVQVMMGADGALALGAVARSLWAQPGQMGAFARTLAGFAKAFRLLKVATDQAGPLLGFDIR